MKKIKVAFVLVWGGHAYQALALVDKLSRYVQPVYIGLKGDRTTRQKIRIIGSYFEITRSLWDTKNSPRLALLYKIIRFFPAVIQSIRILRKTHSEALVSCGGGPSLAPIVAAWLTRRSVIHVESLSRIESYSLTGRISYLFFADLFFVQWEKTLQLYPKAIYAGGLF